MKAVVIGAAGHIGTYLIPMLVDNGYETIAVTRTMSQPYEDSPAWHKAKRVLLDRENDADFIEKLKEMKPDIIVDLVNFNIAETKKIVEAFSSTGLSHYLYCSSCWAHGMAETIPFNPDDLQKEPLDDYGKDKFASEMYQKNSIAKMDFPQQLSCRDRFRGRVGQSSIRGETHLCVFSKILLTEKKLLCRISGRRFCTMFTAMTWRRCFTRQSRTEINRSANPLMRNRQCISRCTALRSICTNFSGMSRKLNFCRGISGASMREMPRNATTPITTSQGAEYSALKRHSGFWSISRSTPVWKRLIWQ